MKELKWDTHVKRARKETLPGRAVYLLSGCRKRAKSKKLDCLLTKEWFEEKLKNGKCELSGIKFDLNTSRTSRSNPFAPSPDRIDITKGYTPENTRLVLNLINAALSDWGEVPFFKVIEAFNTQTQHTGDLHESI